MHQRWKREMNATVLKLKEKEQRMEILWRSKWKKEGRKEG